MVDGGHARSASLQSVSTSDSHTWDLGTPYEHNIVMQPMHSPSRSSNHDTAYNGTGGHLSTHDPGAGLEQDEAQQRLLKRQDTRISSHRVQHFDRAEARKSLVKTGILSFAATIFFGSILCICLKAYEGFGEPYAMSTRDVKMFNALTIAISIFLGLSLLSSLKRYAVIFRWSILTRSYVSIEAFDLILGIDNLINVARLMFISFHVRGLSRSRSKISPRSRYPQPLVTKWTGFACLTWLLINIGSQVLVALLSLFWPVDTYQCPLLSYGNVSVADLSRWRPGGAGMDPIGLAQAHAFGVDATNWPNFPLDQSVTTLSDIPGTPIYKGDDHWEYRFFYRNPAFPYGDYLLSNRTIQARATCEQLEVRENGTDPDDPQTYYRRPGSDWEYFYQFVLGKNQTTWSASMNATCGSRCTSLTVLQYSESLEALYFCNNTISEVTKGNLDTGLGIRDDDEHVYGTDTFARIAAGAIAWTLPEEYDPEYNMMRSYFRRERWGDVTLKKAGIEELLEQYSINAIAAYDDHGSRYNITINDKVCPKNSQHMDVSWRYLLSILGVIYTIQLGALCCLVSFANRAIIRDESFFSTAMLLRPILEKIKDEPGATSMSGKDISNHPKLQYKRIRYDYVEGSHGQPNEISVTFEGEHEKMDRRKWATGEYR
jgi:hypothetical protein